MFVILAVLGVARAFLAPAADALAPNLLPREAIPHGISLNSMTWQLSHHHRAGGWAGLLYGLRGSSGLWQRPRCWRRLAAVWWC